MIENDRDQEQSAMALQLNGFRLTTAEIIYHMPDHPGLLQSFVWQQLDKTPDFPRLRRFLDFWAHNIDGKLHTVTVANATLITPGQCRNVAFMATLH